MTELLQYVVIGLGPAAIYALAALGVVTVYRGSGVVNFAQGGLALVGASVFVKVRLDHGWPIVPAIICGIAAATALGAVLGLVITRLLARSARVMQVIATLGFLSVIQVVNYLTIGARVRSVPGFLPSGRWEFGDIRIGHDRVALVIIAIVLTAGVHSLHRFTQFGRATSAVAEDARAASSLGFSPGTISVVNWALGGALGGIAGVLIVPVSGYSPGTLTLLILPAFAAALIGRFGSFPLTLLGALMLGLLQSVTVNYVDVVGASESVPFVLIVVVLLLSSRALPARGEIAQRLPQVARRPVSFPTLAVMAAIGIALVLTTNGGLQTALITMTIATIAVMSHVVLLGYAGQISLGSYALAGLAALVAARLSEIHGWPFPIVAAIGVASATLAGLVFGVPALRSRGVTLAIVTLGLGIALSALVFANPSYVGSLGGTKPRKPTLFGFDISSPTRYGVLVVAVAVVVAVVVRNIRAGRIGRRLLAIRSNERAAAAIGVNVGFVKLYAFVVAAAIVGVAGTLQAFRVTSLEYSQFDFTNSMNLLSSTLVGGAGFLAGAVLAAFMLPNGVINFWLRNVSDLNQWMLLVGGILLVLTLAQHPNGVAMALQVLDDRIRRRRPRQADVEPSVTPLPRRHDDMTLQVDGLTVRFGVVTAVSDMSLQVSTGQIVGVMGANGAGKTTLIDAVSGFVRPTTGRITLGDTDLTRLAPHRRNHAGLGRSFQSVELFEDLTVRDNLLAAAEPVSRRSWLTELVASRRSRLQPDHLALIQRLNLSGYLDVMPTELPHGARSALGVARAVLTGCPILLLDEPAAGLDERETEAFAALLRRLVADYHLGVLLVEHHVGLLTSVSDEIVVMDFGARLFHGTAAEVLANEDVRRAYLGMEVEVA